MTGLSILPMVVPVTPDEFGGMYVGGTRVPLDTVLTLFEQGATAEEIQQRFPSLQLADIYAVIAYYLLHSDEAQAYLAERRQHGQQVRLANEARSGQGSIRARLLARTQQRRAQ